MTGTATSREAARRVAGVERVLSTQALHLACHAALPVAVNPDLVNLLRINFFLDPPEELPYSVEAKLLLSPLFQEIDDGLYDIDRPVRDLLLLTLEQRYGPERVRQVATLLAQYTERRAPWTDRPELERAQQLTALSFLNPAGAAQWLEQATPSTGGEDLRSEWFIAMKRRLERPRLESALFEERLRSAREQLESDAENLNVRLRSIHILEELALYQDADRAEIVDLLVSYVRRRAPWPPIRASEQTVPPSLTARAPDVQTAMTVLGGLRHDATSRARLRLNALDLRAANLAKADLEQADLNGASLQGADLTGANLTRADLTDADLRMVSAADANLEEAKLVEARLAAATLVGANLNRADLAQADLTNANLEYATLVGARLAAATLVGANLNRADLSAADLRLADLRDAQIQETKLPDAHLGRADLTGAQLTGSDLRNPKFDALLADQERVLGADHPDTLATRGKLATWTGEAGDAAGAVRLFTELLADQERVLGPDHPDTLATCGNLATWTGEAGHVAGAVRLFTELLADQERVLGPDHPDTLAVRSNLAYWTGEAGDAAGAVRLFTELLADQERVLGPDHPDTLAVRSNLAYWTGQAGDAAGAVRLFTELLPDRERVYGPDHPDTLAVRSNLATWTGQAGDAAGAVRLFTELLPDRERVLGADHPDTLATRGNLATWTGRAGDAAGAVRLFTELLPDRERVYGADHPVTLAVRSNLAYWTGQAGDAAGAVRLFTELLPDRERVLGADHPDTLAVRSNLAYWTGQAGDAAGAVRLFTELLPDRERVLGADHPDTLAVRSNLAYWTGQAGDAAGAVRLFTALLADQERVLGADHPDTLATRGNLALTRWPSDVPVLQWPMADLGEAREAFARLLSEGTSERALLVRGGSETGKSQMSKQMIRNAMRLPGVVSGRFDFKGTINMGVEIEAFSRPLGIEPPAGQTLSGRLAKIFTELRRRARPTLLVFDTYEAAGEAEEWIEGVLLPHLVSALWLRVVIIGQSVPTRVGSTWESIAAGPLTLEFPGPEDWLAYGRANRDETLSLEFVTQAFKFAEGKPSLLAGLLGPADRHDNPDPFRSYLLSAGRPFLDREALRQSVRDMMDPNGGRTLVVNGPPASGKSYTSLFIDYIARQTGAFRVAHVDLGQVRGNTYKPIDLVKDLAMLMDLPTGSIPLQSEPTERIVYRLAAWLETQAKVSESSWWVILDGFSSGDVPQDIRLLIDRLAKDIQSPSSNLRLVLLGFDEPLPPDVDPYVHREQLLPPTDVGEIEIRNFLLDLFEHSTDKIRLEDVDQLTISILNELSAGDERLGMLSRRLRELTKTLAPALIDEPS